VTEFPEVAPFCGLPPIKTFKESSTQDFLSDIRWRHVFALKAAPKSVFSAD